MICTKSIAISTTEKSNGHLWHGRDRHWPELESSLFVVGGFKTVSYHFGIIIKPMGSFFISDSCNKCGGFYCVLYCVVKKVAKEYIYIYISEEFSQYCCRYCKINFYVRSIFYFFSQSVTFLFDSCGWIVCERNHNPLLKHSFLTFEILSVSLMLKQSIILYAFPAW